MKAKLILRATVAMAALAPLFLKAESGKALTEDQIRSFVVCPISVNLARENLLSRGYELTYEAPEKLVTAYRRSERDTERFMLGSLSVERDRQYHVWPDGATNIRFSVTYRETRHPHSQERNAQKTTREYTPELTEAFVPTLRDMRQEVCDSTQRSDANASADRRLWDYVLKRCKAGDDEACAALRPR